MRSQQRSIRSSHLAAWLLAAVLLAAAIGKMISPWGFRQIIIDANFLPEYSRGVIFVAVPCIEVLVAALLILMPRTASFVVAIALLTSFTLFIILQSVTSRRAGCNCFGGETSLHPIGGSIALPILRNAGLIALASLGMLSIRFERRDRAFSGTMKGVSTFFLPRSIRRRGNVARGFTLAELLVVIGIIGILLGFLLPTLSKARRAAQASACLSNLRQIGQLAHAWAATHNGYVPLAGDVYVAGPDGGPDDLPRALLDSGRHRYMYSGDPFMLLNGHEWIVPFDVALLAFSAKADPQSWQEVYDWDDTVQRTIATERLFHCPGEPRAGAPPVTAAFQGAYSGTLGSGSSSQYIPWRSTHDYALNGGVLSLDANPAYRNRRMAGYLSAARSSSQTVLLGDTRSRGRVWQPTSTGSRPATLADVLEQDATQIEVGGSPSFYFAQMSKDRGAHGKNIQLLFVDGHAEAVPVTLESLRRCRLTN